MKKHLCQVIALCVVIALLFSGCGVIDLGGYFRELMSALGGYYTVPFSEMEYARPDLTEFREALQAVNDAVETESKVDKLMDKIWSFYEVYYDFYTNYSLANIHYSKDLTDIYWEAEYNFCLEAGAEVDAGLDQLLYTLAACPLKEELEQEDYFGEGFFDDYQGESLWDETFTALMEQESQLQSRYYEISAEALQAEYYSEEYFSVYGAQMAELFVEMIALRQQIADYAGYADYPSFAYDFYYYRDYTPQQAADYMADIRQELAPLYRDVACSDVWNLGSRSSTESQTFDYVKNCAETMGGTVAEAFALMDEAELYDITYSENKYDASFETYLISYYEPYIFMNPTGSIYDQLTFVHEFGHFCNDYASYGSAAGVDVAEVFSQGMEYLSLSYGNGTEDLKKLKMADSLCIYVEQAAYASFEYQVYSLKGEDLTVENVQAVYEQTLKDFGMDVWDIDSRSYVLVQHFFTVPLYIISYVVSNDAALQLYQLEQETAGAGLALYEGNLTTEEAYFLAFVESAGLESPFVEGRVRSVRETLEAILQ